MNHKHPYNRLFLLTAFLFLVHANALIAQRLLLMDRMNANKVVNDSVLMVYSSDLNAKELTASFTMKNNTDQPLAVFLKKTRVFMADSTTDYYCFHVKCWPDADSTDIADTIQPGAEDYTFASHVTHFRRFENPPLVPGMSSIIYSIYDPRLEPDPVVARVTVNYWLSGVGLPGIEDPEALVCPNPASNVVRIRHSGLENDDAQLTVMDSRGQKIPIYVDRMNDSALVNVSNMPDGMYYGLIQNRALSPVPFRFLVKH